MKLTDETCQDPTGVSVPQLDPSDLNTLIRCLEWLCTEHHFGWRIEAHTTLKDGQFIPAFYACVIGGLEMRGTTKQEAVIKAVLGHITERSSEH